MDETTETDKPVGGKMNLCCLWRYWYSRLFAVKQPRGCSATVQCSRPNVCRAYFWNGYAHNRNDNL